MKAHSLIHLKSLLHFLFVPVFLLIFFNCASGEELRDSLNRVDKENRKQGYWIEYSNGTKIREGNYFDNKKNGLWKKYAKSGELSYVVHYKNGQPNGEMISYYRNGNILEKGFWVIDHWEGEYYSYHENGKLSGHFYFNTFGKRTGYQEYFDEEGNLEISGHWKDGNKNGTVDEYYPDGSIKCHKCFENGVALVDSVKQYPKGECFTGQKKAKKGSNLFTGNGHHVLYNRMELPDREGEFKNGRLINGKRYFYNLKGMLIKTAIYQNSKVIRYITHSEQ